MYKVKPPTKELLDTFYDKYSPRIQVLMRDVADGRITIPIKLGTTRAVHLTLQVQNGSTTWYFLTTYSQEANLRRLLCGKWQDHLAIIDDVEHRLPGQSWQKGMLKTEYDAGGYPIYGQDAEGHNIVDNFNEILYWLFVEQIYEGKDNVIQFDKATFVRDRGLCVCPYCGRQWIDMAEEGGRISKSNIDHFLPKSKYPYLAMSFFNMIPACETCNKIDNKGDMDPVVYPGYAMKLLNPHEFYDRVVNFSYEYNGRGENNEKNFKVKTETENDILEEGYVTKLKLRAFYANQRMEVKDVRRRFITASHSWKKFLYNLGVKDIFLQNLEERTLGYSLNDDEASQRLMYKFKKDLLMQLKREYGFY